MKEILEDKRQWAQARQPVRKGGGKGKGDHWASAEGLLVHLEGTGVSPVKFTGLLSA